MKGLHSNRAIVLVMRRGPHYVLSDEATRILYARTRASLLQKWFKMEFIPLLVPTDG
jgi:hypothetical protein